MDILKCLEDSPVIKSIKVEEFILFTDGFYIRINAVTSKGNILFIREYVSSEERSYSYHLQTPDGRMIARWDNAPYHKEVRTFPHHKHIGKEVKESSSITCAEILKEMESLELP